MPGGDGGLPRGWSSCGGIPRPFPRWSLYRTVVLTPPPPARLHLPGPEPTSTAPEGWGRRAAAGSPRCSLPWRPTLRSSQPQCQGRVSSSADRLPGSPRPFVHCLCRSLLFPVAQAPARGLVWGRNLVAKDVASLRGQRGPASLLAVADDLFRAVWQPD